MGTKTKHIDDVQPTTVDKHFRDLVADENTLDYEPSEDLTPIDLPQWYDDELFKAGQRYYSDNLIGITTAALAGLIAVLAIPSILKVLIYTKKSGTPCTAFKRYFETILHVRAWYLADLNDKNSDWYKTLNLVRWRHGTVSRRSLRDGLGGITHRDMALTQFGFVGYALTEPETLGLTNTPKEREGLNHFWRVVGHMLGISDRLNVCRKTEAETTELCRKLKDQVFAKYFKENPPNFMKMTKAMLDGMWCVDMMTNTDAVLAFTYKLTNVPYHNKLGLYSWLNLKYREMIHAFCGLPYLGVVVRTYFYYFVTVNLWVLKKWPIVAWIKYGKDESKINLYPKLE